MSEKLYEHRLSPFDPSVVEVREQLPYRTRYDRDKEWKTYMECSDPFQARRVLALLYPDDVERIVTP